MGLPWDDCAESCTKDGRDDSGCHIVIEFFQDEVRVVFAKEPGVFWEDLSLDFGGDKVDAVESDGHHLGHSNKIGEDIRGPFERQLRLRRKK